MKGLFSWLFGSRAAPVLPVPSLVQIDNLEDLLLTDAELPMIDWDAAESRVERIEGGDHARDSWRRSLAAAWLDRLASELKQPHTRWRTANVEGLAPEGNGVASAIARVAEVAFSRIDTALGSSWDNHPIAPVAIVAVATRDDYYSLKATAMHSEGEFAGSGGCYLRRPFPPCSCRRKSAGQSTALSRTN
jgi:hypothetical protein